MWSRIRGVIANICSDADLNYLLDRPRGFCPEEVGIGEGMTKLYFLVSDAQDLLSFADLLSAPMGLGTVFYELESFLQKGCRQNNGKRNNNLQSDCG